MSLVENFPESSATAIKLEWQAPAFTGGLPLLDYRLWYENANEGIQLQVYEESILVEEYVATTFTLNEYYSFKVEARNAQGFSFFSNTIQVLTVEKPSKPEPPATTWQGDGYDYVVVSWIAPYDGGYELTGYKLSFRQDDLVYSSELGNCDMTSSIDVTCTIPVTVFRNAPFNLDWGSSIYAKVIASNVYGDSP